MTHVYKHSITTLSKLRARVSLRLASLQRSAYTPPQPYDITASASAVSALRQSLTRIRTAAADASQTLQPLPRDVGNAAVALVRRRSISAPRHLPWNTRLHTPLPGPLAHVSADRLTTPRRLRAA